MLPSVNWMHPITLTSSVDHMSSVAAIMTTVVAVTRILGQVAVTAATATAEHRLGGWEKRNARPTRQRRTSCLYCFCGLDLCWDGDIVKKYNNIPHCSAHSITSHLIALRYHRTSVASLELNVRVILSPTPDHAHPTLCSAQ